MARSDPYLTVADFKEAVGKETDEDDATILRALKSASRQIDGYCGRFFGQSADDEIQYITARAWYSRYGMYASGVAVEAPEFVTLSEIAFDDGSLLYADVVDAESYSFLPAESVNLSEPYSAIDLATNIGWPTGRNYVRLTGTFGWPAVPDVIMEATHLIANRLRSLWTAPFGATGAGEMGSGLNMTAALTPMIREMIEPYRILTV